MIDIASTQKELDRLAELLIKRGDTISAVRIRQLIIALGGDPTAEYWSAINIQQVIDPASIAEGLKSRTTPSRGIGIIEWIRNSLVLAPLILTWLGISEATQKYQQLVNNDSTQELHSFLYLWQQGFNHTLPDFLILNNLALSDCVLLALIFALTLIATLQQYIFQTQKERQAELLRANLSHALGDSTLCLAQIRHQQQTNQPSTLADVSRYLHQFGEQFKQTTDQFLHEMAEERKRRGDLSTFTLALDKISKDMLAAATSIYQANTELTKTFQDILEPVKNVPQIVASASQATADLHTLTVSLGTLVADQNRWRQELQTVLAQGLQQQRDEQSRIGKELHNLMDVSFQQLLAEQKNLGSSLNDVANELGQNTNELTPVIQNLDKVVIEQTHMLNGLQSLQDGQQHLTEEMAGATNEIKIVLKSVREAVPELRSMAVDIDRFVTALRAIPKSLDADLLAPLQHYSSAAAKINAGASTLGQAAQYLEDVTRRLNGHLDS